MDQGKRQSWLSCRWKPGARGALKWELHFHLPRQPVIGCGPEGGDPLGPFQLLLWGGCSRVQEQLTEGQGCQPIAGRSWRNWENLGGALAVAITEPWNSTLTLDAGPREEEKEDMSESCTESTTGWIQCGQSCHSWFLFLEESRAFGNVTHLPSAPPSQPPNKL